MKKVALSLAVLFAAALVSCGNKENKAEAVENDTTPAIEAPADTTPAVEAPADSAPAVEAPADSAPAQK